MSGMFPQTPAVFSGSTAPAHYGNIYPGQAQNVPSIEQIIDTALQRWIRIMDERDQQLLNMISDELDFHDTKLVQPFQQVATTEVRHNLANYARQDDLAIVKLINSA